VKRARKPFAGVIKEIDIDARKDAIVLAEERFERRLTEETGKLNQKITEECGKLRVEIEKSKSDIIKWVFVFWIGQIGVLSGILFVMLKLFFDKV